MSSIPTDAKVEPWTSIYAIGVGPVGKPTGVLNPVPPVTCTCCVEIIEPRALNALTVTVSVAVPSAPTNSDTNDFGKGKNTYPNGPPGHSPFRHGPFARMPIWVP